MTQDKHSKPAVIMLVCSHGGHLTEALSIVEAFEGRDVHLLTHTSGYIDAAGAPSIRTTREVPDHPARRLWLHLPLYFARVAVAFLRMRFLTGATVLVSTGAEIAIPCCYLARLTGMRVVFVDSFCRTRGLSMTAKIVRPACHTLFVQWPHLADPAKGLKFGGSVL